MIRFIWTVALFLIFVLSIGQLIVTPAYAEKKQTETKKVSSKEKAKPKKEKEAAVAPSPKLVATYGDWGVYVVKSKTKTCYALAQPKERSLAAAKQQKAYIFISTRPQENVKNEFSNVIGFDVKASPEPQAHLGDQVIPLVAKGSNLWIETPANEQQLIDTMKKGGNLIVQAASAKGGITKDTYSLKGFASALDKVKKECQ